MKSFADKTALVTGASAGIGKAIAGVLAREVSCIILVARREDRLRALASELTARHPELRAVVYTCDLADMNAAERMLGDLAAAGEGVDIFVNNAGFGLYGFFERSEWARLEAMLQLNVVSATFLLRRLVPPMVARGYGAVLNVGSTAGMIPSPAMATYGASKAYLNHLSEGLNAELAGTGVHVTALCPGPVETEFQSVAGTDLRPPMPRAFYVDVVACAEQAIAGLRRGDARVIPGLTAKAAALAVESLPRMFARPALRRVGVGLRRRLAK